VVNLKGKVSSAEKKAKAEEIARKVSGVKSVVNNLEGKPLFTEIAWTFFFQIPVV